MLGDVISGALPELQDEAESLLTDSGELQRRDGYTLDPDTRQRIDRWVPYWSGPMRVRVESVEQQITTGGQDVTILRARASLPVSVEGVTAQDRIVATQCADPMALGVPLYVKAVPLGTQMVLRRLPVSTEQG